MTGGNGEPGSASGLNAASPGGDAWASVLDAFDTSLCFPGRCPVDFRWMAGSSAFLGPAASATLNALTGRFPALRDWHTARHGLGKVVDAVRANRRGPRRALSLPADAVVLVKARGKVAVVLSRSSNLVLKVERHLFAEHSQQCAVAGDECFRRAGLSAHAPELVSCGVMEDGMFHTAWRFVPNTLPLFRNRAQDNWPRTLEEHLLPILQPLYQANGLEVLDGPAWSLSIERKLAGRELPVTLRGFWNEAMEALRRLDAVTPVAMISGDLQPQNIHCHDGRIVILDWSNDKKAAVALDFFCELFYPALREPSSPDGMVFWEIVAGRRDPIGVSGRAGRMLVLWREWLDRWLGVRVTPDIAAAQMKGMCLDWLVTMNHLWNPAGTLWRNPFPDSVLSPGHTAAAP